MPKEEEGLRSMEQGESSFTDRLVEEMMRGYSTFLKD